MCKFFLLLVACFFAVGCAKHPAVIPYADYNEVESKKSDKAQAVEELRDAAAAYCDNEGKTPVFLKRPASEYDGVVNPKYSALAGRLPYLNRLSGEFTVTAQFTCE